MNNCARHATEGTFGCLLAAAADQVRLASPPRMAVERDRGHHLHLLWERLAEENRRTYSQADILASPRSRGTNTPPQRSYQESAFGQTDRATRLLTHTHI
jgi:hypothetical protein